MVLIFPRNIFVWGALSLIKQAKNFQFESRKEYAFLNYLNYLNAFSLNNLLMTNTSYTT